MSLMLLVIVSAHDHDIAITVVGIVFIDMHGAELATGLWLNKDRLVLSIANSVLESRLLVEGRLCRHKILV